MRADISERVAVYCSIGVSFMPEGLRLLDLRDDLVVGVAELVTARAVVLAAQLVDGDVDRRTRERGDDLAVVDGVRLPRAEIACVRDVAAEARQLKTPAHEAELELRLFRR